MRSPAYLFACVLGLLASLSIAIQPIFSSEHKPFTLVAGTIERFNVTLRFSRDVNAYVPTLSLAPLKATEFLLTDGNLTTTYRKRAAFFGDVPDVFPPPLIPLLFGEVIITSPFYVTTDFIIETVFFPSKGFRQQLFSLNGDLFVKSYTEGEPLFVKPCDNTDSGELITFNLGRLSRF